MLTIANSLSLVALYWFLKYTIKHLNKLYHGGSSMSTVLWVSRTSSDQTLVVAGFVKVWCQTRHFQFQLSEIRQSSKSRDCCKNSEIKANLNKSYFCFSLICFFADAAVFEVLCLRLFFFTTRRDSNCLYCQMRAWQCHVNSRTVAFIILSCLFAILKAPPRVGNKGFNFENFSICIWLHLCKASYACSLK